VLCLVQDTDMPLLTFCKHLTKEGLFIVGTAQLDAAEKVLSEPEREPTINQLLR